MMITLQTAAMLARTIPWPGLSVALCSELGFLELQLAMEMRGRNTVEARIPGKSLLFSMQMIFWPYSQVSPRQIFLSHYRLFVRQWPEK